MAGQSRFSGAGVSGDADDERMSRRAAARGEVFENAVTVHRASVGAAPDSSPSTNGSLCSVEGPLEDDPRCCESLRLEEAVGLLVEGPRVEADGVGRDLSCPSDDLFHEELADVLAPGPVVDRDVVDVQGRVGEPDG